MSSSRESGALVWSGSFVDVAPPYTGSSMGDALSKSPQSTRRRIHPRPGERSSTPRARRKRAARASACAAAHPRLARASRTRRGSRLAATRPACRPRSRGRSPRCMGPTTVGTGRSARRLRSRERSLASGLCETALAQASWSSGSLHSTSGLQDRVAAIVRRYVNLRIAGEASQLLGRSSSPPRLQLAAPRRTPLLALSSQRLSSVYLRHTCSLKQPQPIQPSAEISGPFRSDKDLVR
jgi:hypothetical protein